LKQDAARSSDKADSVFNLLQAAAVAGLRCPTNRDIAEALQGQHGKLSPGSIPEITSHLAREGRIVIRLYGHNWREVVIGDGLHAGASTLAPPGEATPYKIIGRG